MSNLTRKAKALGVRHLERMTSVEGSRNWRLHPAIGDIIVVKGKHTRILKVVKVDLGQLAKDTFVHYAEDGTIKKFKLYIYQRFAQHKDTRLLKYAQ